MSLSTTDHSTMGRVASRRNVIRSAAWTTAAVTVVVATPNIAAASPGNAATVTYDATSSYVKGTGQTPDAVKWIITIKNTGTGPLSLTGTFGITNTTLKGAPGGLVVTSSTPSGDVQWGGSADNATRTFTLAKNATTTVTVVFNRSGNASGSGKLSASFVSGADLAFLSSSSGTVTWVK